MNITKMKVGYTTECLQDAIEGLSPDNNHLQDLMTDTGNCGMLDWDVWAIRGEDRGRRQGGSKVVVVYIYLSV